MEDYITNTTKIDVSIDDIITACKEVFNELKVNDPVFSITIVDNEEIHKINKEYRGVDRPTDVISFAFEESDIIDGGPRFLGDIYISIDKAEEQANEYGHSLKRELCFLTVHGLLHILGYDHIEEDDRVMMRGLEEKILEEIDAKR